MANQALFMGWNRPVRGREEQAMKLWGKTIPILIDVIAYLYFIFLNIDFKQ